MPGSILGNAVPRVEDPGILTGASRYVDDLPIDGALHCQFVRAPIAHGRIVSIDVDEDALIRAVTEGWIAGAGLDVFAEEPGPDGHPLYGMENVVCTAHIGGWVVEAVPRLSAVMAREMLTVLRGERPWRVVNPGARGSG